ncbi:helix-turn-helix transcriptional regulator [Bradyrhizobium prioriisuperbiae]|uniref:S24 family peptidase n=1 Tax=Bradyrhizobium prioriisuperbiae TaxID=2854389 RepID=UPI0028ED790D|nr:helix-turn-helix transcriptional regulator [Bradyrhizobium prioritasuperba]
MLTHEQIWTAIDRLATRAGLSPSGLARRSGLDPTTFNKSKRVTSDGRARWPSTESLAKALVATGSSLDGFVQLITDGTRAAQTVPLLGFTEAGARGHLDEDGRPAGKAWREIALPSPAADAHAFALEISGDALKPVYRDGDVIVVSPAAPIRRGDRVVVKTRQGELTAATLRRRTTKTIELQPFGPGKDRTFAAGDVAWIARIVWVSQ